MDGELKRYLDEMRAHTDETAQGLRAHIDATAERLVAVIAGEVGSLHTQIRQPKSASFCASKRSTRVRHEAGLTTTLMELVVKQTRWHGQSDNAVADRAARHAELARRLEELGGRAAL